MNWLNSNWFKIALLALLVCAFLYWVGDVELRKEQEAFKQAAIDSCISDAYNEMKTLQGNYEDALDYTCFVVKNQPLCAIGRDQLDENKKEAFREYEEEWLPQCKLGNRVFRDYKPFNEME